MMDNHLYNLMLQLTQEHKSLWRIQRMYLDDAEGCDECQSFWQNLAEDKKQHVQDLKELIQKHLQP